MLNGSLAVGTGFDEGFRAVGQQCGIVCLWHPAVARRGSSLVWIEGLLYFRNTGRWEFSFVDRERLAA